MPQSRRRFLRAGAATAIGLAGCTQLTNDDPLTGSPGPDDDDGGTGTGDGSTPTPGDRGGEVTIGLETVTDDLEQPVAFATTPGGARYVAEQSGALHVLADDGTPDVALDLTDEIVTGYEQGLLGIAFHPEFESDRRLFVRYSSPGRDGTPDGYSHTAVLASFDVGEDGTVDPASERAILEIPQPQSNHNSGSIVFGPDGYLYVGTGDGGGSNDVDEGHVDDWYDENEGGNGQDVTENLLGGVLRIDVDGGSADDAYSIPDDNPLVGADGLDEYYAWGFRNPWGMSFDGDDLFVADVGQDLFEEVNLVENGGNYGWNVKEGMHCFSTGSPSEPPAECPDSTPADVRDGEPLIDPIIEYAQDGEAIYGSSVIGGYAYRGDSMPDLEGRYVFGDLDPDGRLFVADRPDDDGGLWPLWEVPVDPDDRDTLESLFGFGRGPDDELYVLNDRGVHRITPAG